MLDNIHPSMAAAGGSVLIKTIIVGMRRYLVFAISIAMDCNAYGDVDNSKGGKCSIKNTKIES